jgi:hypothetical protein
VSEKEEYKRNFYAKKGEEKYNARMVLCVYVCLWYSIVMNREISRVKESQEAFYAKTKVCECVCFLYKKKNNTSFRKKLSSSFE